MAAEAWLRREPEMREDGFGRYCRIWIHGWIRRALIDPHLTGLDLDRLPAPRRPPTLVPLFPVVPYSPQAACAHHGAIPDGSALCCMVCHRSGVDGHPALQRDHRTDPAPERAPEAPAKPGKRETRKQRRARLFAAPKIRTA